MNKDKIHTKIISFIAKAAGVDPKKVTAEKHLFKELKLDSLNIAELMMELEDEFEIEILYEEADLWETVSDVMSLVLNKIN